MLIDELDDRDQLLQLVLERRAGQDEGIGAVDALQGARGNGVPVLDPLRLVDDDDLGRPGGDQVEIGLELLVVRDLAEIVEDEILLPLSAAAGDGARRALQPGRLGDLLALRCLELIRVRPYGVSRLGTTAWSRRSPGSATLPPSMRRAAVGTFDAACGCG
jgi:hypothetical protein